MPRAISFDSSESTKSAQSIYARPQKRQRMSITQTYFLAHQARGKLSKEAARPDHDLRLLVGHANMLDSLMLELANAEQEQERWFNKSLHASDEHEDHVDHVETIAEEDEEAIDDDDDDEEDEEERQGEDSSEREIFQITEVALDHEDDEAEEVNTLTRTISHHSPPALSQDSDSDSDDELPSPPPPPQPTMQILSEKQRQSIATTSYYDTNDASILSPAESEAFEQDGFYLPSRDQSVQIAAY